MTFRAWIQLPLDLGGIDSSIDTKIQRNPHIILSNLAALDNGRNPDIGTLKKDRGDIFSECCAEIFKVNFLPYVNEVPFEIVKTVLKDAYLGVTNPTTLKNEVSKWRQIYYYIETRNYGQSVSKWGLHLVPL